jgi:hypothetical protein
VHNTITGVESKWVPKNVFKLHPHFIEKRLYLQKQIANKVTSEDLANLAMNKWRDIGKLDGLELEI